MIEKLTFKNQQEADIEKKKRRGKWYSLHNNRINGKIIVIFVNGKDDPNNSNEQKELDKKSEKLQELLTKLKNNTITDDEKLELMIIKWCN